MVTSQSLATPRLYSVSLATLPERSLPFPKISRVQSHWINLGHVLIVELISIVHRVENTHWPGLGHMPTSGAKGQGQLHPNPRGEMVPGPVLCLLALRFLLCITENAIACWFPGRFCQLKALTED